MHHLLSQRTCITHKPAVPLCFGKWYVATLASKGNASFVLLWDTTWFLEIIEESLFICTHKKVVTPYPSIGYKYRLVTSFRNWIYWCVLWGDFKAWKNKIIFNNCRSGNNNPKVCFIYIYIFFGTRWKGFFSSLWLGGGEKLFAPLGEPLRP